MTSVLIRPQLDGENPWPGLESFQENERAFFFGRDREADTLLHHVLDAYVTVLYGRSGLGKTSLLRAGLFPLLREQRLLPEQHILPVYVRFEVTPGAAPLARQLHQSVRDCIAAELPDAILPSDDESLWEYLHRKDIDLRNAAGDRLTPVIVLDQFEELFTLGERAADLVVAFRNDLGDLAENRIPAYLSAQIEADEAVAGRFDLRSRNFKLVISLREDYLPDLEEWCRLIPALGRARMRLLPLKRGDAFDAVHEPAKDLMTAALAKRVVDIVAGENVQRGSETMVAVPDGNGRGSRYLEPALLSLFCRELNDERKRRGQERFEEKLVEGAKSGILSNYYAACVRDLPQVAKFVENQLITEKGFRNGYAREDAVPAILSEDELNRLIGLRLLRIVDYHGAQRVELTHDVLTKVVREHRDRRRAEEEKNALAETAAELDRERRIGRGLRRLSVVLALVCVVALVSCVVAYVKWQEAGNARDDAANRFLEVTAERLYGQSLLMQSGLSDEGNNDMSIMQRVLAANVINSANQDRRYELLTVLNAERDLLKMVDTPSSVTSAVFSPDGSRIASGGSDGTVRVWDAATLRQIGELKGHQDRVWSAVFSPDGSRIASGGSDGTVRVWDAATLRQIGELKGHQDVVWGAVFSPDGSRIASGGSDGTVRVWDAATLRQIGVLSGHDERVISVVFSPDGSRIASGGADNNVRVWDAATLRQIGVLSGHDERVISVVFSPDGARIASGGADKTIRVWDAATLRQVGELKGHDEAVQTVAFSPDGARIASSSDDKTIRVWDAATLRQVSELKGHDEWVISVAFSPDGARIVSGGDDKTIRVWDARTWQPMLGHEATVRVARFSDDGRHVLSGGEDRTVRVWDAATGRPVDQPSRVPDDDVGIFVPVSENRLLSTGAISLSGAWGGVRLWDAHTLDPVGPPLRVPLTAIAWTPTGDKIAVKTESRAVQIYLTDTMREVGEPIRPRNVDSQISQLEFSPDGRLLVIGDNDGTVQLWEAGTATPVGEPMDVGKDALGVLGGSAVAFSADGKVVAIGYGDSTVQIWDTGNSQPVGDPIRLNFPISTAAFSPDGRTLATGSFDGKVRLWDIGNHSLSAVLEGPENAVQDLEFSPDGTRLLSVSADTLRLWPTPSSPDTTRDTLCAKLTHNMSRDEWDDVVSEKLPYQKVCEDLPEGS